jgi:cytochrome c biogenesis protein CcdA
MGYGHLADVIVGVHVAYVSYVVLGQLLIWLGLALHWQWVRNPWFRWTHLIMIVIVGLEAVLNIECPLTSWEGRLRELAGQKVSGESFVGRLLHNLIFVSWPPWAIESLHVAFALVVLGTFVLAPPRRFGERGVLTPR